MIYVVATLTIHPGMIETLLAAAKPAIAETRKEVGCLSYDLHQSATEPNTFVFVERWESRENLTAHFDAPHFKAWRAAGGPCIAARKIEIISPNNVETM